MRQPADGGPGTRTLARYDCAAAVHPLPRKRRREAAHTKEGPATQQTSGQLHPDDGALQCTSTSWKCVRSPAHRNTEGPSVECARRVACP